MGMTEEERVKRFPSITFLCANCHCVVTTDSRFQIDKRTRFCCAKCEKDYWRMVTRHPARKWKRDAMTTGGKTPCSE